MNIIFLGGTDGPGWIWRDGKLVPFPGWNPEARLEVSNALNILKLAATLKQPGLAESITKTLSSFVTHELGAHAKDVGAVVVG